VVIHGRNNGFLVIANGGMEDHVHLLIQLPAAIALAKAVQLLKGSSSRWINEHGDKFAWQEGYGAFSVSASNLDTVKRYIANQESHHRKTTFEQEFIAFLKKHKIEYDPKYVFD
jgi:putative transposase